MKNPTTNGTRGHVKKVGSAGTERRPVYKINSQSSSITFCIKSIIFAMTTERVLFEIQAAIKSLHQTMTVVAEQQSYITSTVYDQPEMCQSQHNPNDTVILHPRLLTKALVNLDMEQINILVEDFKPNLEPNDLVGVMGTIKHLASVRIGVLKSTRQNDLSVTWANLPQEQLNDTIQSFEKAVYDKTGVPFNCCEGSWAANFML